jgi:hypothetical protein
MKQEEVDAAMEAAAAVLAERRRVSGLYGTQGAGLKCTAGLVVYTFVTQLIEGPARGAGPVRWALRQGLRTVRGYVLKWLDRNGCGQPSSEAPTT